MGEQKNLTNENVEQLKAHLEAMKKDNPDIEYRFWEQEQTKPYEPDTITIVKEIKEKVDKLERQLNLIFGGHVLIDGSFKKI